MTVGKTSLEIPYKVLIVELLTSFYGFWVGQGSTDDRRCEVDVLPPMD
jgi:hypothetical protein